MLRLTQAPDIATAMLWSDLLCEAGMPASVQRQHLGAAAGHLPPGECLPEIWLAHAEHADPARALLRDYECLPQRHDGDNRGLAADIEQVARSKEVLVGEAEDHHDQQDHQGDGRLALPKDAGHDIQD